MGRVRYRDCVKCKGTGRRETELWQELSGIYESLCTSRINAFFSVKGYKPNDIPDRYIKCDNCNGTGRVRREFNVI